METFSPVYRPLETDPTVRKLRFSG